MRIENERLALEISDDGAVLVRDLHSGADWRLENAAPGPAEVRRLGNQIVVHHKSGQGELEYAWTLHPDHVQVSLEARGQVMEKVPLPGSFVPAEGPRQMAVPLYQGVLMRGSGKTWDMTARHGGHNSFSMAMGVMLGKSAGLLVAHESALNWEANFGENASGPFFFFQQTRCPVEAWRGATVRLFPVRSDVTAACKTYRRWMQSRGAFVTWEEKIRARPMVKELFGALMAFVGYNQTAEVDYAQGARNLREYGFERVLYYPLRMCHYSMDFKMGGDDPIWLSDQQLADVRAVEGAHAGPWGWSYEALDDGTAARRAIFRHNQQGAVPNWRIDQQQWYQVCTPYQIEFMKQRFAGDMNAMDWVHYDVNACVPGACCQAQHEAHAGRPLSGREDTQWVQRLFSPETVGNRIVSSEGFTDHNTPWYDIGSTKMMPPRSEDPAFIPVPMTMLVYHDSCAHAWWEMHNYNALPGSADGTIKESFGMGDLPHGFGAAGSGQPQLKAAMDALTGSAPHVFPFGKQYAWRDFATRASYSFVVQLTDAAVQEALAAALPVARLHKKIGPLELLSHELLSPDGTLQSTLFSDGTRILANLSRTPQDAGPHGTLPGHSWRELPA